MLNDVHRTFSLLNPFVRILVLDEFIIRFCSNLTVSEEVNPLAVAFFNWSSCSKSNCKSPSWCSSGNVTSPSEDVSSRRFSIDDRMLKRSNKRFTRNSDSYDACQQLKRIFLEYLFSTMTDLFFNSVIWFDLAAKLLISLIEFLNSFRSRCSSWGFTLLPDVVVESWDWEDDKLLALMWWRRCDDVVFATREDVVVEELFNT